MGCFLVIACKGGQLLFQMLKVDCARLDRLSEKLGRPQKSTSVHKLTGLSFRTPSFVGNERPTSVTDHG